MTSEKRIYLGHIFFDIENEDCRFGKECKEYTTDKVYQYRLDIPCFVSAHVSSYALDGYLDEELKISDKLKCFYSCDEAKVDSWLEEKKNDVCALRNKLIRITEKMEEVQKC